MERQLEVRGRNPRWVDKGRAAAEGILSDHPIDRDPWSRAQLREIFTGLHSTGYLGSTIDRRVGGTGLDLGSFASLLEGLATGVPFLSNHSVQRYIAQAGSPEAIERILPGLLDGSRIGAVAVTEPQGGSNIKVLRSTATPSGAGLILNGRKEWVTHAMTADTAVVLAADEQGQPVRIIVDLCAPGVDRVPLCAHGLRHLSFGALLFNNVRAERWQVLKEDGVAGAKAGFGMARALVAAQAVGLGCQALLDTSNHLATRTARDSRVIDLDVTAQRIGALSAELQAARLFAYHAIHAIETGYEAAAAMSSAAKAHACSVAVRACTELVSMCAGHGLDNGSRIAAYRDDVEMLDTADGTGLVNGLIWGSYIKKHLSEIF